MMMIFIGETEDSKNEDRDNQIYDTGEEQIGNSYVNVDSVSSNNNSTDGIKKKNTENYTGDQDMFASSDVDCDVSDNMADSLHTGSLNNFVIDDQENTSNNASDCTSDNSHKNERSYKEGDHYVDFSTSKGVKKFRLKQIDKAPNDKNIRIEENTAIVLSEDGSGTGVRGHFDIYDWKRPSGKYNNS